MIREQKIHIKIRSDMGYDIYIIPKNIQTLYAWGLLSRLLFEVRTRIHLICDSLVISDNRFFK
jgi:hypothetical protein